MITVNNHELPYAPGSVEHTLELTLVDPRLSHLAGKECIVVRNGQPVARQDRGRTMVEDGDVFSIYVMQFGG